MPFFCVLCQVTRTLLSGSRSRGTSQLLRSFSFRSSVAVSAQSTAYSKLGGGGSSASDGRLQYHRNNLLSRRLNFLNNEKSTFQLLPSTDRKRYCTKALKSDAKSQEEETLEKEEISKKENEDNENVVRRLTANKNDTGDLEEETLTEEERQILRELEEEERRFREKSDDDYYIWDGSFDNEGNISKLSGSVSEGHVPFQNQQRIIQDVIEEMWDPLPQQIEKEEEAPYFPRGKSGVFDLDELVNLLREEKAVELVAISIPKEIDYADYMVIVTVSNNKHLVALSDFVRKRFKMKERKPTDRSPSFDKSVRHKGWIALDLGNIILQIFLQETRDYYDLEMLWTVGPLFDDLMNAKDTEIVQLLNTIY